MGIFSAGFAGGPNSGHACAMVYCAKTPTSLGMASTLREMPVIASAPIGVIRIGKGRKPNRFFAAVIAAVGVVVVGAVA